MFFDSPFYFTIYLSLVSFLINIPLGYIREHYPRFSFQWLFWIHASIPFLIYLRINLNTSTLFIPVMIVLAIWGQSIGARFRRKTRSQKETEVLEQIPDLNLLIKERINPTEVGVVLLNMGGPRTNKDVKNFQKCLFEDPLLIRFPLSFLLQKFFAWLLISVRLKAVEDRYQQIGGGSPIYKSTTAQARALRRELKRQKIPVDVTFSFNYSPPFPKDTILKLKRAGKKYLLAVSLYPHYSKATTGSNLFYLEKAAKEHYPDLAFIPAASYYLNESYIQAFVDRIHETISTDESLDDFYLIFSAHGLPLYFLTEGDQYPYQISQTVAAVISKINRTSNWTISYQSSVGPLQWMKPSTDDILKALYVRGVRKVLIIPIAFVGDHIETIHEINIEYRHMAEKMGFTDYRMSKALETHPGFIKAMADSVKSSLSMSQPGEGENDEHHVRNLRPAYAGGRGDRI